MGTNVTTLRQLLDSYREHAASEREKGEYFERLVRIWLENAPTQQGRYLRVLRYGEWAVENGLSQKDTGIDLVAQLADSPDDWCAVQCKFYETGYRIAKADIDSFFTASGKDPFAQRLIVDSTGAPWSDNAADALVGQKIPCRRIGLSDLEESGIDWSAFAKSGEVQITKKAPREHQVDALRAVQAGLKEADRGKLIMACGTGKTFTALQIAQEMAGRGGRVLFLVPSLSLMSQTIREWSIDSTINLRSFAVCSDAQVGVRKASKDDLADISATDLEIPATTSAFVLGAKASSHDSERMTVVFSTYHSIQAVADAQSMHGLPEFDLIVCDEAHRTTGATLAEQDESNFVKVHDAAFIRGKKRLYMTATPRIFGDAVKKTADEYGATLASMDDESLYGKVLFTRNFTWAVQNGLLTDYKVIVLAVDEGSISEGLQRILADGGNELKLDDVTRIVGCYKALTKFDLKPDTNADPAPMRRALAFCKTIAASKLFQEQFGAVAHEWRAGLEPDRQAAMPKLSAEVQHVDGGFTANMRNERLAWLKEGGAEDECRILTNARCLSEGVDVPALDAILFLHPRKSQIDVVQSVGRVMRRAPGKKMGYVILPIGVPAGMAPEQALNDNERYKVVWQILNALRAHDDRLDATINKIDLGVDPGDRIEIVAVSNEFPIRAKAEDAGIGIGQGVAIDGDDGANPSRPAEPFQPSFPFPEYAKAIMAKIVKKCGTRTYWENWAGDVARIAEIHIMRIKAAVERAGSEEKAAFDAFLAEIRDDLNDSITADEAIEMLAQHLITKPVFDALFEHYAFAANNPVSRALDGVLSVLERQNLEKETESLEKFYASVRMRAAGIESATAKQKIVVELYDTFFKTAFPKLAQRLGIVYTPVEVVDFIIKSVDEVLREEFDQSLSSEGVHIIDPFVGTGTFITRLLQSGLIDAKVLPRKFANEIHANEIVLLAYYIAAINIEATYHELTGEYAPFPGICLTDTFQLYEKEDLVSGMLPENSDRRKRQKKLPIKVIIGNPPYSIGQQSQNDNAANVDYPYLDARIAETYAARTDGALSRGLYDSYVRAIRWGSDRLKETGGVLAFITNASWVDANGADGMRKCLAEEFSRIDVFHLRGNQRTQGEQSKREGGKIFGQGSRAPVAITLLTLRKGESGPARILFHDIGDSLSREQKLAKVAMFGSVKGIANQNAWEEIIPDAHGDWLRQRDDAFDAFVATGDKDGNEPFVLFANYSLGVSTSRDAWCWGASKRLVNKNMEMLIATYEAERIRFQSLGRTFASADARRQFVDGFVLADAKRISWSVNLKADLARGNALEHNPDKAVLGIYRPFTGAWLYFDRRLNERVLQMPRLFPSPDQSNLVIGVSGGTNRGEFSALMTDRLPSLHMADSNGAQYFPRWLYEEPHSESGLFGSGDGGARRDAITDAGLKHFTDAYPGEAISKDDLFYYVYGVLHSPDYRARYADNLRRQLPRVPLMKRAADFWAFVEAGRKLGDLHVNYETVEPYSVTLAQGDLAFTHIDYPVAFWRVEKMKHPRVNGKEDLSRVFYNPHLTITNIPLDAYAYVVNGKPALKWVMERQGVSEDQASGIVNDANAYANETVGDPRYPFDLFCRIITVSLETMKIVKALPPLDIREVTP